MKWRGNKIANVDGFFGKSDPYLKILKVRGDNSTFEAHRTETKNNSDQPDW